MNRERGLYDVQFVSGVKTLGGSSRSTSRMPKECEIVLGCAADDNSCRRA